MTKEYEEFLAHYGVKGQKWGVRNYQNEDGSLTPEGRRRYGIIYGSQMDNIASVLKRRNLTDEHRETLKKEYADLKNLAERSHTRRTIRKAALAVGAAHLLTGGMSTKLIAKAGSLTVNGAIKAAQKFRNSKVVDDFMKKQTYRKMGAVVLGKSKYSVG